MLKIHQQQTTTYKAETNQKKAQQIKQTTITIVVV